MSFYLALDLAILAGPLLLSFDRKVAFHRNWPSLFSAVAVVAPPYLIWDVLAVRRGHWDFSERYASSFRIFGLPPGEILFFVIVPYACIFLYEVIRAYLPGRPDSAAPGGSGAGPVRDRTAGRIGGAAAILFLAAGAILMPRGYSALAAASVGVFLVAAALLHPGLLRERHTWIYLAFCIVPFLLVNGILTSLPVVTYGADAILGFRIFTIPIEDFFYNLSLLGFSLLFYRMFRDRRQPDARAAEAASGGAPGAAG